MITKHCNRGHENSKTGDQLFDLESKSGKYDARLGSGFPELWEVRLPEKITLRCQDPNCDERVIFTKIELKAEKPDWF